MKLGRTWLRNLLSVTLVCMIVSCSQNFSDNQLKSDVIRNYRPGLKDDEIQIVRQQIDGDTMFFQARVRGQVLYCWHTNTGLFMAGTCSANQSLIRPVWE